MKTETANGARTFLALDKLKPDPNQPRKNFDAAKLQELADSIKEQGIIQDLIVREEKGAHFIVDGERRWRAAKLAGLTEVPVALRQVDEKRRLALQVVANNQRENLSALEEAAAYAKEIESGRHTAETLYRALGVSRATLFARLALNKLEAPVRKALERGEVSTSVAALIATVPDKKAQEEVLFEVAGTEWDAPMSVRDTAGLIERDFCRSLKDAPFDTKKEYTGEFKDVENGIPVTVMLHLRGACTGCRFRSGNMPEAAEFKNANVCTRPKCFEAKSELAWKDRSEAAGKAGQKTLSASQWKSQKGQYVVPDANDYIGGAYQTWKVAMGGQVKNCTKVLAQTPDGVIEVVPRKEAIEAAKKNGVKVERASGSGANTEWEQKLRKKRERAKALAEVAKVATPRILQRLGSCPADEVWRLLAGRLCFEHEFMVRRGLVGRNKLEAAIAKWTGAEVRTAVLEAQFCSDPVDPWSGEYQDAYLEAAEQAGVDLKQVEKELKAQAKDGAAAKNTKSAKGAKK